LAGQRRQRELQLEQARYDARLAQRQYERVDPDHRLVASELERRWNEKLERVAQLEQAHAKAEADAQWDLTSEERAAISAVSQDLPAIWAAPTTTNQDRKQLLRSAIDSVQLDGVSHAGQIEVQIRWQSGVITRVIVERYRRGTDSLKTPADAVDRIHELAPTYTYAEIAAQLNCRRMAYGSRSLVHVTACGVHLPPRRSGARHGQHAADAQGGSREDSLTAFAIRRGLAHCHHRSSVTSPHVGLPAVATV
jgi:hypothetical protein